MSGVKKEKKRDLNAVRRLALAVVPREREKDIQQRIVRLYRALGCKVYSFSQWRATGQTPGIPDLYVVHLPTKYHWWHEVKKPKGAKWYPGQIEFRTDCVDCDVGYTSGGDDAAELALIARGIAKRGPGIGQLIKVVRPQ